jgi:hypothetical protein
MNLRFKKKITEKRPVIKFLKKSLRYHFFSLWENFILIARPESRLTDSNRIGQELRVFMGSNPC